jgi:DNA-directed RNA polymerase specialized sigma24 family protein
LHDRDDLWSILFTITDRQAARQARDLMRGKRGGGEVHHDLTMGRAENEPADQGLSPDELAAVRDSLAQLLGSLDEDLRRITLARMEGYSIAEIAQQIGRSEITVQRRLGLIRAVWQQVDEKVDER